MIHLPNEWVMFVNHNSGNFTLRTPNLGGYYQEVVLRPAIYLANNCLSATSVTGEEYAIDFNLHTRLYDREES